MGWEFCRGHLVYRALDPCSKHVHANVNAALSTSATTTAQASAGDGKYPPAGRCQFKDRAATVTRAGIATEISRQDHLVCKVASHAASSSLITAPILCGNIDPPFDAKARELDCVIGTITD